MSSANRHARLFLLVSLYFAQGLPFGFFTQALPVLLRKDGRSLGEIGLASLLSLPWALKFIWAPLVDRHGARRTWILLVQALTASLLFALAFMRGESLDLLYLGAFLANVCAATQDIATDGLAVNLLGEEERGFANGLQVAGYRLGMIAGGGAILILFERTGWTAAFSALALLTIAASVPVWFSREARETPRPASTPKAWSFFKTRGAYTILGVAFLYKLGEASGVAMLRPFLADRGLTLSDIGFMLGTVAFLSGLCGALFGGYLTGILGRRRALIVFGIGQTCAVSGYAFVSFTNAGIQALYLAAAFEHFASGCATACLFTSMMDHARKETASSDYTIMASTVVLSTGLASTLSGFSAQKLGYTTHFLLSAAVALIAVLVVAYLYRRSKRVAVYAGTFDPPTVGHVSIVERASAMFDRVIVLAAINPDKKTMFAEQERLIMLREATAHLKNIEVTSTEGYVVDFARANGAGVLVRGLRGATDADYETSMAHLNRSLAPELTTIFIPAEAGLLEVSSTKLKEMAREGKDVSALCPKCVEEKLCQKSSP
jgi:pantetheine-phosphate adenylyltransferase